MTLEKIGGINLKILALALPLAYWPATFSVSITPRWTLLAGAIGLIGSLWPRWREPGIWLMGAWLAWGALTLLWSPDRLTGEFALCHLGILAGVFIIGSNSEESTLARALDWLAIGLAINGLIAIYQLLGGTAIAQGPGLVPAGLFYNKEVLAEICAPVLVWVLMTRRNYWEFSWRPWFWSIVAGLLLVPIVFSGSRIAVIAVGIGIGSRYRKTGIAVAIGLALLSPWWFSDYKLATAMQRLQVWKLTWENISWLGSGLGQFQVYWPTLEYSHNDILQILWELGIGAVAPVGIGAIAAWRSVGSKFVPISASLAFLAGTSFSLQLPLGAALACLLAGHLACRRAGFRLDEC